MMKPEQPNNITNWIQRILAYPFLRILFLLLLFTAIFIILFSMDFSIEICCFAALLMSSAMVESLRRGSKWHLFGLSPGKAIFRESAQGISLAVFSISVIFLFYLITGNIQIRGEEIIPGMPVFRYTFGHYCEVIISVFLFASFEELLFRGIIFQSLTELTGKVMSVIITSILFSLAHYINEGITFIAYINIFLAGCLLSLMYLQTKSLWMPVFWHFGWNVLQALLFGSMSGFDRGIGLFAIDKLRQPYFIYGGNFGIEGTILTTVLLLLSAIPVSKLATASPYISAALFRRSYLESRLKFQRV